MIGINRPRPSHTHGLKRWLAEKSLRSCAVELMLDSCPATRAADNDHSIIQSSRIIGIIPIGFSPSWSQSHYHPLSGESTKDNCYDRVLSYCLFYHYPLSHSPLAIIRIPVCDKLPSVQYEASDQLPSQLHPVDPPQPVNQQA